MSRPAVDVVVPFGGSRAELVELLARLHRLRLGPDDTLRVVDNRPDGAEPVEDPRIVRAPELQGPAFSRNAGVAAGSAPWIVFLDSDVEPPDDLLDLYFEAGEPAEDVGMLAGEIDDQEPATGRRGRQPMAARYAYLRRSMAQRTTRAQLAPFAKTANVAVRRVAFEAVDGFHGHLRSGEDVDLTYRLNAAGWRLEFRDDAAVEHRGRQTIMALLAQQTRHGAGTQWLDGVYPGFSPPYRRISLVVSMIRGTLKAVWFRGRRRNDRALTEFLDPLTALAFEVGRWRTNVLGPPSTLATARASCTRDGTEPSTMSGVADIGQDVAAS